jgi:hypothetical protein
MFRSSIVIRELVLSLVKVILEHLVKLFPYRLCGGVAACLGVVCVCVCVCVYCVLYIMRMSQGAFFL